MNLITVLSFILCLLLQTKASISFRRTFVLVKMDFFHNVDPNMTPWQKQIKNFYLYILVLPFVIIFCYYFTSSNHSAH